jgi:spore coat polysaccharide biosynthesis protein SpsF
VTEYITDQEKFWAGAFGTAYARRNAGAEWLQGVEAFWRRVLAGREACIGSIIEFGANIGLNVAALRRLLPAADIDAVEINPYAAAQLRKFTGVVVHEQSLLDFVPFCKKNLVITKGVLIHVHPDHLPAVYDLLFSSSDRYILIAEYYNPRPVEVDYRGHTGKLFKRDFAGELLDRFENLDLVEYGFVYHRDTTYVEDDTTWFLLEKTQHA